MADPDIRQGVGYDGGSRHSAGENLICFPVSHVFPHWSGAKVFSQTEWDMPGFSVDPPLSSLANSA